MYDAYNSYTGEVYCALYPSKGISLLITSAKNSEASVYNDCLFITESEYDYNGNGRVARTETCFTRPDSSDEYTEINRVGQNYEYLNESYKRIVLSNRSLDGRKMSLTESVESTGFITVCDGDNYYRYDEFGDSYFVTAYSHDEIYYNFDSNYAVAAYSFSEFEKSILITNYVTGATKFITSNFDGILGFRSGCIYYYDEIIGDDRIKSYEIKMYSAWEDETYTLYTTEYNPGVNYDHLDGVTDFYLCGDTIYTTIFNGLSTNWYTITASEDGYSVNDTGCVAKTYSWREYGIMNAQYYRDTCPYCGQTIYSYYSDIYSVLDDIPNYEKINSKLVELDEVRFSANGFTSGTITQEYCDEYHNSEYYFAGDTIDFNVSEVKILSSNYIAIYFDGYTYSGGVHGYPLKTQYVFDLNTGDYIEFSNLFSGSEEDLKELVANAAKADCASDLETYGYTDYYENDPELVYTSAYETVSLETLYGEFEEDGYHVFFSPYEMGPYASGYIEVIIPYSDLGITIF